MSLSDALVALDRALTGKESAATSQLRRVNELADLWDVPSGVLYLSDGGYSRIWIPLDPDNLCVHLCQGARSEVAEAWRASMPEREAVDRELQRLLAELGE
jgi:hypothetical protein